MSDINPCKPTPTSISRNSTGDRSNNPYRAPAYQEEKKPPFFKPLIEKLKKAAAVGTLLSAPAIATAVASAEYHDGKPTSAAGLVEHVKDWTGKLAPLGYGAAFLAEFANRKKKEEPKPLQ